MIRKAVSFAGQTEVTMVTSSCCLSPRSSRLKATYLSRSHCTCCNFLSFPQEFSFLHSWFFIPLRKRDEFVRLFSLERILSRRCALSTVSSHSFRPFSALRNCYVTLHRTIPWKNSNDGRVVNLRFKYFNHFLSLIQFPQQRNEHLFPPIAFIFRSLRKLR